MKAKHYLLLLLLTWQSSVLAAAITGRVVDRVTREALPFASVGIMGTTLGTTTNAEGAFSLAVPAGSVPVKLRVSYIGYRTETVEVSSTNSQEPLVITLEAADNDLKELIVMPDSSLRQLLRKAYARIEQNYPTRPLSYQMFYRESLRTPENRYVFAGEALLHGYVSGYQNTTEDGQVEVERVRVSRFAGRDSLTNVVFMGGPFCFATADFVKRRAEFLRGDKSKYRYELVEETVYDNRPTYVVIFAHTRKKTAGQLLIDKQTLAYRSVEVSGRLDSTSARYGTNEDDRAKTTYRMIGNHWYLQYLTLAEQNKRLGKNVIGAVDILVTDIDTNEVRPIPPARRIDMGYVFYHQPSDTLTPFGQEFTTLVPPKSLGTSIQQAAISSRNAVETNEKGNANSTLQRIIGVLLRIEQKASIRYVQPTGNDNLSSNGVIHLPTRQVLEPKTNPDAPIPLYLSVGFGYVFNRHWSVQYNNAAATLQRDKLLSNFRQLSVSYHLLLKKTGNPLVAKPSLGYYWQRNLQNIGQLDNSGQDVSLGGKNFRTDEVNLYFGPRSQGVVASLKVEQKLDKRKWLYLEAGASQQMSSRLGFAAEDASGFSLFRRSSEGFVTDEPALQFDGQTPDAKQKMRFYAEVGLRLSLF